MSFLTYEQVLKGAYYILPKTILNDYLKKGLSSEAIIIYILLLSRLSLSEKNGWTDASGEFFIICTYKTICEITGCGSQKASAIYKKAQ